MFLFPPGNGQAVTVTAKLLMWKDFKVGVAMTVVGPTKMLGLCLLLGSKVLGFAYQ